MASRGVAVGDASWACSIWRTKIVWRCDVSNGKDSSKLGHPLFVKHRFAHQPSMGSPCLLLSNVDPRRAEPLLFAAFDQPRWFGGEPETKRLQATKGWGDLTDTLQKDAVRHWPTGVDHSNTTTTMTKTAPLLALSSTTATKCNSWNSTQQAVRNQCCPGMWHHASPRSKASWPSQAACQVV